MICLLLSLLLAAQQPKVLGVWDGCHTACLAKGAFGSKQWDACMRTCLCGKADSAYKKEHCRKKKAIK